MKPDFALHFRNTQIALLHRQETGWAIIGRVAMDDPDLDAAMAYLRATALGLSPRGVSSKLILPNEAILYTELSNLPYGHDQRRAAIAQALAGRTPYDVGDLVYDWTDAGASAHVAVIARETLEEAEGFASQHRFNPIYFAALPDQGGYDGEVWFGATQISETLLARGEVIERDDVTLLAVDADIAPTAALAASDFEMGAALGTDPISPDQLDQDPTEAQPDQPSLDARDLQTDPSPPSQQDSREVLQDFAINELAAQNVPANVAYPAPDQAPPLGLEPKIEPVLAPAAPLQPEALRAPIEDSQQKLPASFEAAFAETPEPTGPAALADAAEAPMAVDVPLIDDLPALTEIEEKPQTRTEKILAAFAARRDAALSKTETEAKARRFEPVLRASKTDDVQPNLLLDQVSNNAGSEALSAPTQVPDLLLPQNAVSVAEVAYPDPQPAVPASNLPKLGVPDTKLGRAPEVPTASGLRPAVVKHVPAKPQSQKKQDLKSMPRPKAQRRLGMGVGWILTIVLLLALLAAGALSEFMLTSYNALYGKDRALVMVEPGQVSEPALQAQIAAPELMAAPKAPVAGLPIAQAVAAITATPKSSPIAPAATPLAQTMPPSQAPDLTLPPLARMAVAQNARPSPLTDATAGETTALADAALPAPLPRMGEATRTATASAAVLVRAGRPALVPSPRPDLILAAATIARPSAAITTSTPAPDFAALPAADPALAGVTPLPRPASVLAAAKAAAPILGPPPAADPALADARPAKRPDNILSAGRAARLASASASIVAGAEAAVAEAALAPAPLADDPNRSPLAVSVSRIPAPRPTGLKSAFDATLAAAAALDPVPEAIPPAEDLASNAAPADESAEQDVGLDGGAAERSVVAKQATQRNMLNLRDTNLVGIFGSQSNRYALIRQPGGSFKKLQVGDRFDGGRIAAITESEVRYEKGGDLLALRMPKI